MKLGVCENVVISVFLRIISGNHPCHTKGRRKGETWGTSLSMKLIFKL